MQRRFLYILTALLFCFNIQNTLASDIENDPVSMSLSTIILFALDNNPDMLIANERINQMRYYTKEASSEYLPRIDVQVKGGRQYLSPTSGNSSTNYGDTTLRLSQKVYDGNATTSEVHRREKVTDSATYKANLQRTSILIDTIKFYLTALRYQNEVKILQKFANEINLIVLNINELYNAGAISKVMNDYAVSRQAATALEVSRAQSYLNDAVSNLEFLTGSLPDFTAENPDYLMPEKYDFSLYFERAEQGNDAVKVNQADLDALKHKLNKEKAAYMPDVDFNISAKRKYNDGGDVGSTNDVSAAFTMRYDIFDGFLRNHKTSRVGSEIKELEFKNRKIIKELRKDLELAYHQILSSKISLDSVHSEIKNNINVKLLNSENFKLGNLNAIELIEGEERLKDAYLKRQKLNYTMNLNKYTLLINATILGHDYFCASCDTL